ncbi:hypothetical protein ECC02_010800 [Trypanosoma cruzi]|uniref:Uncharacterized protein n=1 Tax=Trypanosoma cruzi TaxID=5693 RepID=A0A7J6XPK7_TRYCR|nr:hypothetical protein ECC02_010800 [Trypanosoma cruzi]
MCVGVCWRSCKEEEHREAHQHSKRHSWMAAIHAVRPQPQQSRTVAAHTHHTNKRKEQKKKKKTTRRQGVAGVCVALRVSARPGRKKTKQEGKKCVLRPTGPRRTPTRHGSLSAPFVAAPPHACSRRGAQGRRHERVGGFASGAVGRETHGTPHRKSAAETIKRGKSRKGKNVHSDCPQKQNRRDVWSERFKMHKLITQKKKLAKNFKANRKKLNLQKKQKAEAWDDQRTHSHCSRKAKHTHRERERERSPTQCNKNKTKQLWCSAHAARQDGSGACGAKESTNGPAWVCMHIYNGHIMCVPRGVR